MSDVKLAIMRLNYQLFSKDLESNSKSLETLVIIPGLFGSISNWRSVAKKLSNVLNVIVIDQRNHGQSPHFDTHSYKDMVADLKFLLDDLKLSKVHLSGHSMGGKVAMLFAIEYPKMLDSLIVMDIAPAAYTHSHAPFLESLLALNLEELKSRSEADALLKDAIDDMATRLFLLQSLAGKAGEFFWRLNLPVLHEFMPQIMGFPDIDASCEVPTLMLRGEASTYIEPKHHDTIHQLFPNSEIKTIPQAGHWMHADQPEKVVESIKVFLKK